MLVPALQDSRTDPIPTIPSSNADPQEQRRVRAVMHQRWHRDSRCFPSPRGGATTGIAMTTIDEIAPDLFRLSVYVPDFDMQFNHFLVRDEEPLLFHAGFKGMFPVLREAVATLIDPTT